MASWRGSPQLPGDASIPATGIGHLQIFSSPYRAQAHAKLSGQGLRSQILLGQGRKMPVHSAGEFVQQKEEAIRTRSASICTAERPTTASPDNLPNSLSCREPWGRWPGPWARSCPAAPVWGWGHGCTEREFLGQVSGAGSAVARRCLQMVGGCGGGSPDGCAAGARLPRGDAPSRASPYPRPARAPDHPGDQGDQNAPKSGTRGILLSPQPRPTLPSHPRRFVVWRSPCPMPGPAGMCLS